MNSSERIELFQRELSYISDSKLQEFAKILIRNAEEYFFEVPASSSGKYHPKFALGDGGLVRHTKAVAYFVNELIRPSIEFDKLTRYQGDCLIIAAIVHDMKKQGKDGSEGHTVREHPQLAAEYVREMWDKFGRELLEEETVEYIEHSVERHMGPWQEPRPSTLSDVLVFYGDYIASRREITGIEFIDNDDNTPVEAFQKPVYTVEGYKFDFGKTKGMTIKEAYESNPGYIKWIAGKEDFGNTEVRALVKEFLNSL